MAVAIVAQVVIAAGVPKLVAMAVGVQLLALTTTVTITTVLLTMKELRIETMLAIPIMLLGKMVR